MPSCGVDPGLERRPKGSVSSPTLRVGHACEGKPSNATPRSGGPAGRGSRLHPGQCTPENVTKSGAPDEGSGTARVNPRKVFSEHVRTRIEPGGYRPYSYHQWDRSTATAQGTMGESKLGLDDGKVFGRPSYARAFCRRRTRAPARELSHPSIVEHRIDERYIP